MHAHRSDPDDATFPSETANDRLKRRAALWQSNAIVAAVLIHFAVLAGWPAMSAGVASRADPDSVRIIIPDPEIPEAPEQIPRPRPPVIVDKPIDITPPPWTIPWDSTRLLPPPPAPPRRDRDEYREFVPSMVAPRVLNSQEVERALLRHYPPVLRDAGVGGDVSVLLWLDEKGTIVRAEIGESSGREALDRAALEVVKVMRLSPALNMNQPTRVIVSLPVRFMAR